MRKAVTFSTLVLAASLAAATGFAGHGPKVVKRERLGNNSEDITYVSKGKHQGHVAIVDGREVLVVDASKSKQGNAKSAFDFEGWALGGAPRGIAFVESEERFYFNDPTHLDMLIIADDRGEFVETRTITYLGGFTPAHCEALSYIPPGSPQYPDHLLMVTWDEFQATRIQVIRLDGQVVAEILPGPPLTDIPLLGMEFVAPDRIIVTELSWYDIYTLDFDGNVLGGVVSVTGNRSTEGLAQIGDGSIVAADYAAGTLTYFDADLVPTPDRDRSYRIGLGVSRFGGISWDPSTDEFILSAQPNPYELVRVDDKLKSATGRVPMAPQGWRYGDTAFLAAENLTAAVRNSTARIDLFDSAGVIVEQIPVGWIGSTNGLGYIESTGEFALTTRQLGLRHLVYIVGRDGALVRTVDLSPLGVAIAVNLDVFDPSDPSGGRMVFTANGDRILVTDVDGVLIQELDDVSATLGAPLAYASIAAITSGKHAGAFAASVIDTSELVVFTLD